MWGKVTPKFKVTTDVRSMLLANEEIKDIIDGKIFPLVAPDDTKGTFIVYQRDKYQVDRTKMGANLESCWVYVSIVSDNYDQSQDLAEKVFITLNGDHDNGLRIWLNDSTEDVIGEGVNKKYIQVLLFEITNH